jgi:hypothetical protein
MESFSGLIDRKIQYCQMSILNLIYIVSEPQSKSQQVILWILKILFYISYRKAGRPRIVSTILKEKKIRELSLSDHVTM